MTLLVLVCATLAIGCKTNDGGSPESPDSHRDISVLTDEVTVDAPAAEVWAVISDHDSYVHWAGVDEMEVLTENRQLHAKRRVTIGSMVLHQTIDEFEPDSVFAYSVRNTGPFEVAGSRWTLEPDGERTRVKLASSFKLKFGLPSVLFAWRVRGGQEAALYGLKNHIEETKS